MPGMDRSPVVKTDFPATWVVLNKILKPSCFIGRYVHVGRLRQIEEEEGYYDNQPAVLHGVWNLATEIM